MSRTVSLLTIAGICLASECGAACQAGIGGQVLDENDRPVRGALVVVCDAGTGIPVSRDTFQPFTKDMQYQKLASLVSDQEGRFEFVGVAAGTYRLIVQSWEDASEPATDPLAINGSVVRLRGIIQRVVVPSDEATRLQIRPCGTASLKVITDPKSGNSDTLLVVSSQPLAADPILGFAAWSGPFVPAMLAGNRMPLGRTTFHGLPAGRVHIGAFANDNNPGFGGTSCELTPGRTANASISLIASWSDGHKTPPARLEPLVRRLREEDGDFVQQLMRQQLSDVTGMLDAHKQDKGDSWSFWIPYLQRPVTLGERESFPLKDILAADRYRRLAEHDERRRAQQRRDRLMKLGVDISVSYEQAFRDLYDQLGRTYPCFQLKGIDWQAVGDRLLPRCRTVSSDEEFGLLCLELVASLEDSHAQLRPAAAPVPAVPFPIWDAGFACLVDDRSQPVIYFLAPGEAAESAGLAIGMTVKAINGVEATVAIKQTEELLSRYIGYSSDRYLRYHAFRFFARQQEMGDRVEVTAVGLDGREQTFVLQATRRSGYVPRLPVPVEGISDSGDVGWKMLDGELGYIYVRRIRPDLTDMLDRAVAALQQARGLIVDVRGNSGGGFDAGRAHRNFEPEDGAEPGRPRFAGPMALLVDARCISAGEGWASWFVARQRARLFGETTAGASSRKTTYLLTNGLYSVVYPVKAYRGFLDRPIERRGLEPDVPVMPTAADLAARRDTVLETAAAYLRDLDR